MSLKYTLCATYVFQYVLTDEFVVYGTRFSTRLGGDIVACVAAELVSHTNMVVLEQLDSLELETACFAVQPIFPQFDLCP